MGPEVEYLLSFLQDELRSIGDARIHAFGPAVTQRALDLTQDYDPKTNDLHLRRGVRVRIGSREWEFPADWVKQKAFSQIQAQAQEIKDWVEIAQSR